MKRILFALALASAPLTLASCATTPDTHLTEARGLSASWAALDAVAVSIDALAVSRTLHGPAAADAALKLGQARDALLSADAAYRAGQTGSAQENVARASALIASLLLIAQSAHQGT